MGRKKVVKDVTSGSVEDIRNSIRSIDESRRDPYLTPQEREVLELSAVTLRKAERVASAALQKQITDDLSDAVKDLKKQSSLIRARITRMSKVPEALDKVESVIGGVVSVLKEISRWSFCVVITVILAASCSVLTKSQVRMAAALSSAADTVTVSPSVIFSNLARIRKDRGLLYSASLSSPQAHWEEVTSLSSQRLKDVKQIQKAGAYIKALNSYARALSSLTNTTRWKKYGTELRGIGRNVDSALVHVNRTGWVDDEITTGFSRLSGRSAGILAENYMKIRQAKAVKALVTEADTMVTQCVESLITILKSDSMVSLLDNEKSALKDDYRAFLDAASLSGEMMSLSLHGDAVYMECDALMSDASAIRTKCITALQSFSRAHKKLVVSFRKRSAKSAGELVSDIYDDISELNLISVQLSALMK